MILCILGTRPEAIKLAPVIAALRDRGLDVYVLSTGQHRDLLPQALSSLAFVPDEDLALMVPGQSPPTFLARAFPLLLSRVKALAPRMALVQGDTETALAGAMAAFHAGVALCHVEAGLRTHRPDRPFPEEMNRRLIARLANLHCAPTDGARRNLLAEGVDAGSVVVTGNPVVDALATILRRQETATRLEGLPPRYVAVTVHRREHIGVPIQRITRAFRTLVDRGIPLVLPVHKNPGIRASVQEALEGRANAYLLEPLPYLDMVRLLRHAAFALTDSGGIQEEGPTLGIPVLVLREETERPELLEAQGGAIVGTDADRIVALSTRLWEDEGARRAMIPHVNPFGQGRAGDAIAQAVLTFCGVAPAPV